MGTTGINVDNSQKNTKTVVNGPAPKTQAMPVAIPVGRNKAAPPPQVYVPVAVSPAPITYALNPSDIQSALNQPAAVMLGEGPEMAAYVPPVYTTEAPTEAPAEQTQPATSPEQIAALVQLSRPQETPSVPFWKKPEYVMPLFVIVVVAIALWFAYRGNKADAQYYQPYDYY